MRRWARSCAATGSRPACRRRSPSPTARRCKVRLLGEDLVVFRDSKGRVGVLDEYCSHRRASLVFARNEECGLRCLYHGWKFDVDGNVVEMASEPADSLISDRVKHKAYPAREAGGFVWAYMGPAGRDARIRAAGLRADAGRARQRDESARALQLGADPRRADRLRAFLQPAFVRHGAGAGRWREGDRSQLAAALDRQGAALPDRAHQLRLPLCGDPAADQERGRRTTTSAPRSTSRRSPR